MNFLKKCIPAATTGLIIFTTPSARAHPGHELLRHGASHALFSPDHFLIVALLGLILAGLGVVVRRKEARRIFIASGSSAAVGATAFWTLFKCI